MISRVGFQMFENTGGEAACPTITLGDLDYISGGTDGHITVGSFCVVGLGAIGSGSISAGVIPASLSVTSGTIPPGCTLNHFAPIPAVDFWRISGIPTTFGSYTFTIGGTDANGCAITPRSYNIKVGEVFTNNTPEPIVGLSTQLIIPVSGMPNLLGTNVIIKSVIWNATSSINDGISLYMDNGSISLSFNNYYTLSGSDFTDTIFDTSSVDNITDASAPYTGSFSPSQIEAAGFGKFDGTDPNTSFNFTLSDDAESTMGSFDSISILFLPN